MSAGGRLEDLVSANYKLEEKSSRATEKENSINSETVIFEMACTKLGGEDALARAIKRGDVKVTDQGAPPESLQWNKLAYKNGPCALE